MASLDADPGVHRQAAVTTTSSLHAAGAVAGATVGLLHVLVVQVSPRLQVAVPHLHCDTVLAPEPHVGVGGFAHVLDDAVHFCPSLQFWFF